MEWVHTAETNPIGNDSGLGQALKLDSLPRQLYPDTQIGLDDKELHRNKQINTIVFNMKNQLQYSRYMYVS